MRKLISLLIIIIGAGVIQAQKVKVAADPSVNLSKYKTYAWAKGVVSPNPLIGQLIIDSIDQELTAKGMVRVTDEPDVTVVAWAGANSDLQILQPGFGRSVGSATATGIPGGVHNVAIAKGTLLIAITDAQTKSTVWRGTATQTLKETPSGNVAQDAKNAEKSIRKAVEKMFKKFPAREVNGGSGARR